ncbi:MAG: hypothetical protein Q7S56_01390 [Nanoarchaeota archaeon]|nr:hypothetical protein [Nanoarchaeota archaeon]
MSKILIINISKERLHYYEFVKPIEDILKNVGVEFYTKHYTKFNDKDLKADKIIICGTSLMDNDFIDKIESFKWIEVYKKPILGICGGMQVISLIFNGELGKESEIGLFNENFVKSFLGMKEKKEVYHLHNNYITLPLEFEQFTSSKIPQAIKHKEKEIYGVLFHPEVRNKSLIENFVNL